MDFSARHGLFMQQALEQAQKAFEEDEVPIGAIVVDGQGTVIARDYNKVEQRNSQAAHAEMLVLAQAGEARGDWRLEDCWLYVTLEPCHMCFNALLLSRMKGIVFGATSPLFGYHLDNGRLVSLYNDKPLPLEIVAGIHEAESVALLQCFFKKKRNK